jgi:hypothetical protein
LAAAITSFDDIIEKFSPGESFGTSSSQIYKNQFGKKNEKIPENYQREWRSLVEKIQHRDMFARIEEVKRAADGGFYWRNVFDAYWSDMQFTWSQGGAPGQGNNAASLSYPLNIYQSKGRAFVKIVGHKPDLHFVSSGDSPTALQVAEGANHLLEEIENLNDTSTLAQDFARIAYTDGRYAIYTRWVADGARFGYYDEEETEDLAEGTGEGSDPPEKKPRRPKGGEVMSIFGVPWVKTPINAHSIHDFTWLMLSDEIDISAAKAMYPSIAKKIRAGEPGPAEFIFDRTTRIALTQGLHLVSQMAESLDELPTLQTIWVRPCMFAEIEDEKIRSWFEDSYPDGGKVVFLGDQYAESCNESMDDHWSIGHAIRGHGQSTPAYGYSMLVAQDAFSDAFDLEMETHMRCIPAWYGDPQVFDFPSYTKEKAMPGARYPLKHDLDPQTNVGQKFMVEPQIQVSAQLIQLRQWLATEGSTAITGISNAAVGQADENNTTLGGISILRAASRGEAGTAFQGFIEAYARSCEQAVRIGAKYRLAEADKGGVLTIRKKGHADVMVDLVELRDANFWCVRDSDQSYPSTFEEEQLALTALVMAAANGDSQAKALLEDPSNQERLSQLRGISDLKSSVGNVGMKVTQTIEILLSQKPLPNEQAQQQAANIISTAQQAGQPAPTPDPHKMFKSSLKPGPLDNPAAELPFFIQWVYSPAGQRNKYSNHLGYANVELYAVDLQQRAQQAAQAAQQQAMAPQMAIEQAKKTPQQRHPSESIQFKDLGPQGKIQLAAQAGLDVTADAAADLTDEHMQPPPQAPEAPQQPSGA